MKNSSAKISDVLMDMKVGEVVSFPIERLRSVRAIASQLGIMHNRVYPTTTDREERIINVTRKK